MSNCPSLRFIAVLLAIATVLTESSLADTSPPYSSASINSQPLLDQDILAMLNQVGCESDLGRHSNSRRFWNAQHLF